MIGRRAGLLAMTAALPGAARAQATRLPPVVLLDQAGRRWPLVGLAQRRPVLVSFFFTGCTAICPPQTAALAELQAELARRAAAEGGPLLLSISLDPLGDTPDAMRAYAARFGIALGLERSWLMLGGDPAALARVWAAFEVPGGGPESHLAFVWIGREGGRSWRRAGALEPPEALAALLLEPPA
ncbi:SCO family protein [Paracraurococcus lichenis]|uniref:SCO family protein n=1 Tax=Paracraurococcus lichenis TaxID=3064888 RepID=A0ABT9EB59_9PROT|nr:SCO family protein [Paracraurococcus sp. LOR1-02]MDO9713443.1 SCO family protein [Paracraurococcus sp. LOR1-02]